jgi:hypothetical protein
MIYDTPIVCGFKNMTIKSSYCILYSKINKDEYTIIV